MSERKMTVFVTLTAGQVETTREWFRRAGEFPTVAWNYALEIEKLLTKDVASPEDGAELAKLVAGLREDALRAGMVRDALVPVLQAAVISDPEGRKEPLQ